MPTHWSDPKYTAACIRYNYLLIKNAVYAIVNLLINHLHDAHVTWASCRTGSRYDVLSLPNILGMVPILKKEVDYDGYAQL